VFSKLRDLVVGTPRSVLDLGCGTGDLARPLAALVDSVDAIDCAPRMIERGKRLPDGDRPNLRWILGNAEEAPSPPTSHGLAHTQEAPLPPTSHGLRHTQETPLPRASHGLGHTQETPLPRASHGLGHTQETPLPRASYGLITAGESLHWMDWDLLFPRLCTLLAPGAYLAMVSRPELPRAWSSDLLPIIQRYTTNRDYQPYSLVDELAKRGLFEPVGEERTPPLPFRQPLESYVESIHSRNGFSRDRMTCSAAAAFDAQVESLLTSHYPDRTVELEVVGRIVWGRPRTPAPPRA
jgi:SAM-dependent methyltransferase